SVPIAGATGVTVSRSPCASVSVSSHAAASTTHTPQPPIAFAATVNSGVSFGARPSEKPDGPRTASATAGTTRNTTAYSATPPTTAKGIVRRGSLTSEAMIALRIKTAQLATTTA